MKIWVDADACPVAIREILFRAAQRSGIELILVANHQIRTPKSRCIKMLKVEGGFDVADKEIVNRCSGGDLVITSDIPLAAEVIEKGAHALSVRGELFSVDSIKALLNMRDFMDALRASGINTGGPSAIRQSDRKAFADNLDKLLTKSRLPPQNNH